jgi:outer membrane protein OmpA-like peptidoglycan-associated protein
MLVIKKGQQPAAIFTNLGLSVKSTVRSVGCVLFLFTTTSEDILAQEQPRQTPVAYHVFGWCHDYGTALGLKANVYAVFNQTRQKLADCQETGNFDVLLPVSATHIALEMNGYRTVIIPVYFTTNIPPDARFGIANLTAMARLDSLPIPPSKGSALALHFNFIDSIDVVKYRLTGLNKLSSNIQATISHKRLTTITFPVDSDDYESTVSTTDGRLISSEKITLKPGVTLKTVRVTRPAQTTSSNGVVTNPTPSMLSPSTATIYFNQSSYELRFQVKATLDSIARLLVRQPRLMVTVTGYTDNVGKRELNMTLSEFRARTVETYLKQHGVLSNQIVARWEGPDTKASLDDMEAIKTRSRRVVIELAPK